MVGLHVHNCPLDQVRRPPRHCPLVVVYSTCGVDVVRLRERLLRAGTGARLRERLLRVYAGGAGVGARLRVRLLRVYTGARLRERRLRGAAAGAASLPLT